MLNGNNTNFQVTRNKNIDLSTAANKNINIKKFKFTGFINSKKNKNLINNQIEKKKIHLNNSKIGEDYFDKFLHSDDSNSSMSSNTSNASDNFPKIIPKNKKMSLMPFKEESNRRNEKLRETLNLKGNNTKSSLNNANSLISAIGKGNKSDFDCSIMSNDKIKRAIFTKLDSKGRNDNLPPVANFTINGNERLINDNNPEYYKNGERSKLDISKSNVNTPLSKDRKLLINSKANLRSPNNIISRNQEKNENKEQVIVNSHSAVGNAFTRNVNPLTSDSSTQINLLKNKDKAIMASQNSQLTLHLFSLVFKKPQIGTAKTSVLGNNSIDKLKIKKFLTGDKTKMLKKPIRPFIPKPIETKVSKLKNKEPNFMYKFENPKTKGGKYNVNNSSTASTNSNLNSVKYI